MITEQPFNYRWNLADKYNVPGVTKSDLKVFGTFICGGGSSMGYKLAGFNHLGGVDIDKDTLTTYINNHHPKYTYGDGIIEFNKLTNLPDELYNLDILDGSPPCTTFSISGDMDKTLGKIKTFKEGDILQCLSDLLLDYINTVDKLKPKVMILENVKGLIIGNNKSYVKAVLSKLDNIGYIPYVYLLNSKYMGIPQSRERVFIIAHKKELPYKKLQLEFNCKQIPFKEIQQYGEGIIPNSKYTQKILSFNWPINRNISIADLLNQVNCFNNIIVSPYQPVPTVTTSSHLLYKIENKTVRLLTPKELTLASSFPLDYVFSPKSCKFLTGMSVPPLMTANIALQIRKQWFKK